MAEPTRRSKDAGKSCCAAPRWSWATMRCKNCGVGYLWDEAPPERPKPTWRQRLERTIELAGTRLSRSVVRLRQPDRD